MTLLSAALAPAVGKKNDGTTEVKLTDNSGGTADATLEDVNGLTISVTYAQAEVQALRDAVGNNIADLAKKIEDLIDHMNDGR